MSQHTTRDSRAGYPTWGGPGPVATGATTGRAGLELNSSNQPVILSDNGTALLTGTDSVLAVGSADMLTVGGIIVPQDKSVVFHAQAATAMVDQSFFVADRAYTVTRVDFVHAVAEATAANLRVQVTKDSTTAAPGAGANLLTNNSNAGFNCKATANTVQNGTLTATAADLLLAAGDRLSVDFEAGATELVGVTIVVTLKLS